MKMARFESDYAPGCFLNIIQNVDSDIIIKIHGKGECRIATSGGKLGGSKLVRVIQKFSEIIDILNEKDEEP